MVISVMLALFFAGAVLFAAMFYAVYWWSKGGGTAALQHVLSQSNDAFVRRGKRFHKDLCLPSTFRATPISRSPPPPPMPG